jgi:hypothetical protein
MAPNIFNNCDTPFNSNIFDHGHDIFGMPRRPSTIPTFELASPRNFSFFNKDTDKSIGFKLLKYSCETNPEAFLQTEPTPSMDEISLAGSSLHFSLENECLQNADWTRFEDLPSCD